MIEHEPSDAPANASPATAEAEIDLDLNAAFQDFYRENTTPLVAFLILHGASLVDAADIAQDTMAAAYRRWQSIDYPRAWTYRVASRALIRRVATVRETPVAEPAEAGPLLGDTDIEQWEQRHDIGRFLACLPLRQRQIMAWTLAGYTPAEIAAELRLTPDAVRANLFKARRALRAQLAGKEGSK